MKIGLTGNLRRYVDFDFEIALEAGSVLEALRRLGERYPDAKEVLFDAEGRVRSVHRVTLNGAVLGADELERAAGPADEVVVLTPIAGG
jgi:molybdopterin synthase sulfur carrier subunit